MTLLHTDRNEPVLHSTFVTAVGRHRSTGAVRSLVSALLSAWTGRAVAAPKRSHKSRGSPRLPAYLRQDVGLSPIDDVPTYWDHQ
jgi:hypothetical protein